MGKAVLNFDLCDSIVDDNILILFIALYNFYAIYFIYFLYYYFFNIFIFLIILFLNIKIILMMINTD